MVTILVCLSLVIYIENEINIVPISALISIMIIGAMHLKLHSKKTEKIKKTLNSFWDVMQIFLFVSVGVVVDFTYFPDYWRNALFIIFVGTIFRFMAVWICLIRTRMNNKEKLFCCIAYLPKATVQATFSTIPLMLGLSFGPLILTVCVMAILILTPVGSLLIEFTYKKLLIV